MSSSASTPGARAKEMLQGSVSMYLVKSLKAGTDTTDGKWVQKSDKCAVAENPRAVDITSAPRQTTIRFMEENIKALETAVAASRKEAGK